MESVQQIGLKVLGLLLLFLAPIQATIIASLALVLVDTFTGVWASLKEGRKITSFKLRRTVIKSLAYMTAIVAAQIIEVYMVEGVPLVKAVAGLVAMTEGKSIFENLNRITGVDFFKMILEKLQGSSVKLHQDNDKK